MPVDDLSSRRRAFRGHVRRALLHLYDPIHLRRNPLLELLGIETSSDRVFAIREVIQKAVQALKPERSTGVRPLARQIYQILNYRFIEQMAQKEVAAELAISLRQLQRQEAVALETLSAYLLETYHVRLEDIRLGEGEEADGLETGEEILSLTGSAPEVDLSTDAAASPFQKELEWVRQSGAQESALLSRFIQEVLETTAPLLAARLIRVDTELPSLPLEITGNLMALRQGLINILTTMTAAFSPGSLRLAVQKPGLEPEQVTLRITCEPDFAPSADLRISEDRVTLARELFRITGGALEYQSNPGQAAAWVTLPTPKRRTILVVDDHADALALVEAYLAGGGLRCHGIRDPQQVLSAVEQHHPDLILLDVMLPGVDGWQILGRLKHNPKSVQIPVVISTILPQAELAYSLGADGFLRKPFSQAELLALIAQLTQPGPESP